MNELAGLNEADIPADELLKVRAWWVRQMQELAAAHGCEWSKHRDWLADYLNAEVRNRLTKGGS